MSIEKPKIDTEMIRKGEEMMTPEEKELSLGRSGLMRFNELNESENKYIPQPGDFVVWDHGTFFVFNLRDFKESGFTEDNVVEVGNHSLFHSVGSVEDDYGFGIRSTVYAINEDVVKKAVFSGESYDIKLPWYFNPVSKKVGVLGPKDLARNSEISPLEQNFLWANSIKEAEAPNMPLLPKEIAESMSMYSCELPNGKRYFIVRGTPKLPNGITKTTHNFHLNEKGIFSVFSGGWKPSKEEAIYGAYESYTQETGLALETIS